jgi:hypothetical protein
MQHTIKHQDQGVHCNLWIEQLASSKSTLINYLQWKKYASFAKLLMGR